MNIKEFYLALQIKSTNNLKNIGSVVANDADGNKITIALCDGSIPFDITGYTTITFTVLKPDNTYYIDSLGDRIEVIDDEKGLLSIVLGQQSITALGNCVATVEIFNGSTRLTSSQFMYSVENELSDGVPMTSESDYPYLQQLISQLSDLLYRYDAQVINAGNSNSEIVDARGAFGILRDRLNDSDIEMALRAPLDSPVLTGNPTAPTQSAGDNTTNIASTAYVDSLANGWRISNNTFTFLSATGTPSFTMTVPAEVREFIYEGIKIQLTQLGIVKRFIVTAVSSSAGVVTITMFGGTDSTLTNDPISLVFFSNAKSPQGFPLDPAKWTVKVSNITDKGLGAMTAGIWINSGISIIIPIGAWNVSYQCELTLNTASGIIVEMFTTLSTSSSTQSDLELAGYGVNGISSTFTSISITRIKQLNLSALTTYYLLAKSATAAITGRLRGDYSATILSAVCAYL